MRKQKKSVTIIAMVLAVLMVLSVFGGVISTLVAGAASVEEIDQQISETKGKIENLESESESLDGEIAELQTRLASLRDEEGSYLEEVAVLEQQKTLLEDKIDLTEGQIDLYETMIADKEEKLAAAVAEEEEQLELYKKRIRAMEERGSLNYIQILLSSKSFSELVTKMGDINEIMNYDQSVAEQLEADRIAVQEYKDELQRDMDDLEILVAQLEDDKAELERQIDELDEAIVSVQAKIDEGEIEAAELQAAREELEAMIDAYTQDVSALSAEREAAIKELEEQAAAGGGGFSVGLTQGGMFMWPSDNSTRVTSGFGPRSSSSTNGVGSTNHQGIDIGAANGSNVLAAASGYVVQAGYNGGYGNFILLNHGDGYYTAYAHQSQLLVSTGENVAQGQIIGKVGSTGNSTGPHLHFEVRVNGTAVNPLNYF